MRVFVAEASTEVSGHSQGGFRTAWCRGKGTCHCEWGMMCLCSAHLALLHETRGLSLTSMERKGRMVQAAGCGTESGDCPGAGSTRDQTCPLCPCPTKKAWQGKHALRLRGQQEAERASLQLQHREQARVSPRRADTTLHWCVCG